jgi:hypothetical protein
VERDRQKNEIQAGPALGSNSNYPIKAIENVFAESDC